MPNDRQDFSIYCTNVFPQKMSFILIFKYKYFQANGLPNVLVLFNQGLSLLTDVPFTVYRW